MDQNGSRSVCHRRIADRRYDRAIFARHDRVLCGQALNEKKLTLTISITLSILIMSKPSTSINIPTCLILFPTCNLILQFQSKITYPDAVKNFQSTKVQF